MATAASSEAISPPSFSARCAALAWRASGRSRFLTSASMSRARATSCPTRASFSSARCRRRLNFPKPSRLLDECAALLGLRGEDLLDLALGDDGACGAAEPDVCQQLHEVGAANRGPVDQVLPLAASVQAPHDGHLGGQVGQRVVRVVEHELDLAAGDRLPASPSREQHVVGLLRTKLVRAQASRRPQQRIGHVRLPGAVRPDDHGDARLEADLDRFGEGLEAADADGAEIHARRTLVARADGARPAKPGRRRRLLRSPMDTTRKRGRSGVKLSHLARWLL